VLDPQHRDLVAAGVDGEQETAVVAQLERTLRGVGMTSPRASDHERGPLHRGQRPIGMAVEPGDGVNGRRVVVDVHVADHE
jgi:hypothetical protein